MPTEDDRLYDIVEEAKKIGRGLHDREIIYRVEICSDGSVEVSASDIDHEVDHAYNSVDDLPEWIQKRLAILSIMSYLPPTSHVNGIGRRISENIFWVVY